MKVIIIFSATIESEDTSATYEISMHTDEKKKKKNSM